MNMTILHCLLADPSFAAYYDHASLSTADSQRLAATLQLTQRQDWQISRVLRQQTDLPTVLLSHSQGFAALLCAPYPLTAGIDIEFIHPRDFKALPALVCTQEEQDFLETANWPSGTFYRLWCSKETLVRAANLDFPLDMKSVGYIFDSGQPVGSRAGKQTDWRGINAILADTMALAYVWQGKVVALQ